MPLVGLNPIGFYIPLYLSLLIVTALGIHRKFRITRRGLAGYLSVFLVITVVSVVLFLITPDPGSFTIPREWSLSFMTGSGLLYSVFFVRRRLVPIGMLESYATGTFAMIANDAVRTFLIPLPVSLRMVYWGGYGVADLIVQLGVFMLVTFTATSIGVAVYKRSLVQKLVGAERAALFWSQLRGRGPHDPVI